MKQRSLFCLTLGLIFFLASQAVAKDLTLGILPRRPAPVTMKMFKPLADKMGESIGANVTIKYSKNFQTFMKELSEQKYDIAHIGISMYLKAQKKGYRLLAKNEEFGSSTISSALYVRKDSGINAITDLKGKTIVFGGDKTSLIPYIGPTYLLYKNGLKPGDYNGQIAQNPYNAVYAVFKGAGDAGCAADITLSMQNVKAKIKTEELKKLAELGPYPQLPWVVSNKVDDDMFAKVQSFLFGLNKTEEGRQLLANAKLNSLQPVSDEEYNLVRKVHKEFNELSKASK